MNQHNYVKVNLKQQTNEDDDELDLRRGPWTVDEDLALINYIAHHGEGRWNSLAHFAGLKRTGKSCRLRWLNYLRPDVRRGNITLEEQLLILELHSRWGNKWSKIAQHLPGRTDNEIKNYWRTRVQKHAKQLKCDVNSKQFKDTMRYLWMPRLVERIQAAASAGGPPLPPPAAVGRTHITTVNESNRDHTHSSMFASDNSSTTVASSSESFGTPLSDLAESNYTNFHSLNNDHLQVNGSMNQIQDQYCHHRPDAVRDHHQIISNGVVVDGYCDREMGFDFAYDQQSNHHQWMLDDGDHNDNYLWNVDDDLWFLQNQFDCNF